MIIFKENYFEYFNKKLFFLKDEFSKKRKIIFRYLTENKMFFSFYFVVAFRSFYFWIEGLTLEKGR